jgi:hypothetical protein
MWLAEYAGPLLFGPTLDGDRLIEFDAAARPIDFCVRQNDVRSRRVHESAVISDCASYGSSFVHANYSHANNWLEEAHLRF